MCDEAGANFLAIEAALGTEFLAKTISCQWHFRQCAKNHIKEINEHERETFRVMAYELCFASTVSTYDKISSTMRNICECNNLGNWWNWWDTRKFHIVPAFHRFNLPGIYLAEAGNSVIECHEPMSLAVAAWQDMIMMIIQDCDYHTLEPNWKSVWQRTKLETAQGMRMSG